MSFGNNNRSFGTRSTKKRKQEFHKHKIHPVDITDRSLDLTALKERTIGSLTHLGQQRFNQGPGGYSFDNWMKSFNLLLDDFESSFGSQNLPRSFFDKRLEISSTLSKSRSSNTEDLDNTIVRERAEFEKVSTQINDAEIENRKQHDLEDRKNKLKSYEEEKAKLRMESERIKDLLIQKRKKVRDSSKLLNRILGVSAKSEDRFAIEKLEAQLSDTNLKVDYLTKKIEEQDEKILAMNLGETEVRLTGQTPEKEKKISELRTTLEQVSSSLEKLEAKKLEQSELLQERIQATESMRLIILDLKIQ